MDSGCVCNRNTIDLLLQAKIIFLFLVQFVQCRFVCNSAYNWSDNESDPNSGPVYGPYV